MSKQGEMLDGVEMNPNRYRELSEPFETREQAMEAVNAFAAAVKAARIEHRIPDVVVSFTWEYLDEEGEPLESGATLNFGNSLKAESIAAFALGKMQALREEMVARALKLAR